AVKGGADKLTRLLQKRTDLKKLWIAFAGVELMDAAVDWLAMQGVEEFIATGEIAKFAIAEAEAAAEEEEDDDLDEDEDEEAEGGPVEEHEEEEEQEEEAGAGGDEEEEDEEEARRDEGDGECGESGGG